MLLESSSGKGSIKFRREKKFARTYKTWKVFYETLWVWCCKWVSYETIKKVHFFKRAKVDDDNTFNLFRLENEIFCWYITIYYIFMQPHQLLYHENSPCFHICHVLFEQFFFVGQHSFCSSQVIEYSRNIKHYLVNIKRYLGNIEYLLIIILCIYEAFCFLPSVS